MFPGSSYVLAALAFVVSCAGCAFFGWHERGKQADAEEAAVRASLEAKVAQAQKLAAETSERVVIRYKDRVHTIIQTAPEIAHDVQILRATDCKLPLSFVRIHNAGAGSPDETPAGADDAADSIDCAQAAETIKRNYEACRVDQERLTALQEWARSLSSGPQD